MGYLDIDPDTAMIAAGVVISLIALLELYPAWKRSRNDGRRSPAQSDDRSANEK